MLTNNKNHSLGKIFKEIFSIYFSGPEKTKIIFLCFTCLLFGAVPAIDSLLLREVTDHIESMSDLAPEISSSSLFIWTIIYAVWWESLNILWRIFDYLYLKTIPNIKGKFIEKLFSKVMNCRTDFFQEHLSGDISASINNGAISVEMIFYFLVEKIFMKLSLLLFALITLYSVHPFVGNVFIVWIFFFISISLAFAGKLNKLSTTFNRKRSIVTGRMVDSISNISIVRLFNARRFERKFLRRYIDDQIDSERAMHWFLLKLRYALGLITSLMVFGVLYYLIELRSQNIITIGECVLIITLCIAVVDDIWDITQEFGDLFEEIGSFTHALSLGKYESIKDNAGAAKLVINEPSIEFVDVTFNYKHNDNIFKNKSVFIPALQRVGLVGFSGSGKTTFTKLLTRLNELEHGKILISGTNIQGVTLESLRSHISVIPQEPILFDRSVFDNIRYGSHDKSDHQVIEAAKAAHIHNDIMSLPKGYNSDCGERGNKLSIGQKQRIMIARAFLKNAPILILDEATSALDTRTEKLIQDSLEHLMKGKTVLIIAHRLTTLFDMDRILVFENGDIVEDGTHDELKNNGKVYQILWESQKKGYI